MSILTWRDVSAPDFGPASNATAGATGAMNNAFTALNQSLQGARDLQAEAADRAIQQRALAYQDPAAFQTALANGTIVGPDGAHARVPFLAGLNDQAGQLLLNDLRKAQVGQVDAGTENTQAETRRTNVNTDQAQILNDRANQIYATQSGLAPIVTGLVSKYSPNGSMGVAPALAELNQNTQFAKLSPDDQNTIIQHLVGGIGNPVTGANSIYTAQVAGKSAMDAQTIKNETERIMTLGGQFGTQEDQLAEALKISDPAVRQGVLANLNTRYPGITPTTPSTTAMNRSLMGGVGADWDPDQARFLSPGTPALPKPISQMTIAEAAAFGDKMREANGKYVKDAKGNEVGSSAMTPYMMINGTREAAAKALFKSDPAFRGDAKSWDQVMMTPDNVEKMGKFTIDQAVKNGNLDKVWTSLTPDDMKTITASGNDYGTIRALILKNENVGSIDTILKKMSNQQTMRQEAQRGVDTSGTNNALVRNWSTFQSAGIGNDPTKGAEFLTTSPLTPQFHGADPLMLRDNIQALVNRANEMGTPINSAQAAQVLAESTKRSDWFSPVANAFQNMFSDNQRATVNGRHIDISLTHDLLKQITNPDLPGQAQSYDRRASNLKATQLTDADFEKRMKDFKEVENNFKLNPTDANRKLYANALSNLQAASATQATLDANNYNSEIRPPVTPSPTSTSNGKVNRILDGATNPGDKVEPIPGMSDMRKLNGVRQQFLKGDDGQSAWVNFEDIPTWKMRHNVG